MLTRGAFLAGSEELSPSANFALNPAAGRVKWITPSAGLNGTLPDARLWPEGGPLLYALNGGSNSFSVVDNLGGSVSTVSAGNCGIVVLLDGSTQAGTWAVYSKTILT